MVSDSYSKLPSSDCCAWHSIGARLNKQHSVAVFWEAGCSCLNVSIAHTLYITLDSVVGMTKNSQCPLYDRSVEYTFG